jgi:hypothetical protein
MLQFSCHRQAAKRHEGQLRWTAGQAKAYPTSFEETPQLLNPKSG